MSLPKNSTIARRAVGRSRRSLGIAGTIFGQGVVGTGCFPACLLMNHSVRKPFRLFQAWRLRSSIEERPQATAKRREFPGAGLSPKEVQHLLRVGAGEPVALGHLIAPGGVGGPPLLVRSPSHCAARRSNVVATSALRVEPGAEPENHDGWTVIPHLPEITEPFPPGEGPQQIIAHRKKQGKSKRARGPSVGFARPMLPRPGDWRTTIPEKEIKVKPSHARHLPRRWPTRGPSILPGKRTPPR